MVYQTKNPYTNEVVKTFPEATDAEVSEAIAKAHKAFQAWRLVSFAERGAIMQKAADLLRSQCDELSKLLTLEMGKLFTESQAEVELCATIFEYYANNAGKILATQELPLSDPKEGTAHLVYQPLGVLLCVEPWNFPFYQLVRILAPQLSAGNTILLKHASNVPQCAARMERLLLEAGLPEGCFRNLYATRSQVGLILADPRVHGVALTGSERAGAQVAEEAARNLKKSTMELGGADAFIVLKDADLEKAVKWAVLGRHFNSGQMCVSSKRMIIADEIFEQFLQKYQDGVAALRCGDPMDASTTLAPLSSQSAADSIREQIKVAVAHGAKAIEVGPKVPTTGAFAQPTILLDVTPKNPAYHMEFFGPVSMVLRFKTEEEAIEIANDSPYGLGGSVFTQDEKRGYEVASKIETGMVSVNHPARVRAYLPFGGVKRSGYGRELAELGIKEFVNHKLIQVVPIDAGF